MLHSSCLAWMSPPKHILCTFCTKAVLPGNSLFKLTLAGCQRNQAVRKSYLRPHAARGYRVKLQRWEYTEWRTPENNNNNNIWKIPIRLTSVGLAHARPNYPQICMYMCACNNCFISIIFVKWCNTLTAWVASFHHFKIIPISKWLLLYYNCSLIPRLLARKIIYMEGTRACTSISISGEKPAWVQGYPSVYGNTEQYVF